LAANLPSHCHTGNENGAFFDTSLDSVPDESLVGSQPAESPSAESLGEFVPYEESPGEAVPSWDSASEDAEVQTPESLATASSQLHMVSVRSPSAVSSRIQSGLSEFLVVPTPGARKQPKKPQFARVLTSSEYLKGLERKEKEKREKRGRERKEKEGTRGKGKNES